MEFTFEVGFDRGSAVVGGDTSSLELISLARMLEAKAKGMSEPLVALDGATKTLGQVRSIEIRAQW